MDCDSFPCLICDHLDGSSCSADGLGRDVADISACPLYEGIERARPEIPRREKPDIGHWVIRQPDGLFCYYNEVTGRMERRDMTLEEVIRHREEAFGMSHQHSEDDTRSQVEHQPVRWDDILFRKKITE